MSKKKPNPLKRRKRKAIEIVKSPLFRPRTVPDKTKYSRKKKER